MKREEFEPGRPRTHYRSSRNKQQFLGKVLAIAGRQGGFKFKPSRRFVGSYIGRGTAAARALSSSDRYPGFRSRRGLAIIRIIRFGRNGIQATKAHLHYIQRGDVGRDGGPGQLYSAERDLDGGKEFLKRCEEDRHGFRIIVSVDDSPEYDDFRPLVRRFMAGVEEDLGTQLDWVAADHYDTFHPHTHVVLRGVDDRGKDLIIGPEYMNCGMTERLSQQVSIDLGPKTGLEIEPRIRLEVEAERLTSIDVRLFRDLGEERIVTGGALSVFERAIRIGRLRKLEALGLAEPINRSQWRLGEETERTLQKLGERSDCLRTLQRALNAAGIDRARFEQVISRPHGANSIKGMLVEHGLVDEMGDREYLVIDGTDGRGHYVQIGRGSKAGPLPERSIVRVTGGAVGEHERSQPPIISDEQARVELLSPFRLEHLPRYDGATWLDREIVSSSELPRDSGFGRAVRSAMSARRVWLIEQGLASLEGKSVSYRSDMVDLLQRREILRVAAGISKETGWEFAEAKEGVLVEGIVRRRLNLASGSFAMIDNGWQFSLVPWRSTQELELGRSIEGIYRSGEFSWTISRSRGIEI